MLKNDFGAKKVFVFGSLTDRSKFHLNSDIDLAEEGIPDEKYFAAVGAVTRIIENFRVDLVDLNCCRNSIKKTIEKEGVKI